MEFSPWVDVVIGLSIIYLGTSLFVTVINEYIAQGLTLRGGQLCDSLKKLISDKEARKTLKQSPVLKPSSTPSRGRPLPMSIHSCLGSCWLAAWPTVLQRVIIDR